MPRYWVNTATLNLVVEDIDFSYQGLGPDMVMKRTYNGDPTQSGMFGKGWSFSYESWLKSFLASSSPGAAVKDGSGQLIQWACAPNCSTYPTEFYVTEPKGLHDRLITYAGYWVWERKASKLKYRYEEIEGKGTFLKSITDRNGNIVQLSYTPAGLLNSITDAAGRVTAFNYDGSNRCVKITAPDGNAAFFSYNANGNLTKSVDLIGNEIAYSYDSDGFLTSMAAGTKVTSFAYSGTGKSKRVSDILDALGNTVQYGSMPGWADQEMIVWSVDPLGQISYYDSQYGKTLVTEDPLNEEVEREYVNGLPVTIEHPNGAIDRLEYDGRGNLTKRTDPYGEVTTFAYDSTDNRTLDTNALGQQWHYDYDGSGNLTGVTSPLGYKVTVTYDDKGQMVKRVNSMGQTTSFGYDASGNLASTTDPLGNVTRREYDLLGNQTSVTNPRGFTTHFTYDKNRRLVRITHPDGTYKSFTYDCCAMTQMTDENGFTTIYHRNELLLPTQIVDPLGNQTSFSYNASNKLVSVRDAMGNATLIFYDAANRPVRTTDPLGNSVNKGYDGSWKMTSLTDERGKTTNLSYDNNSRLSEIIDPLGYVWMFYRDAIGRVTKIDNPSRLAVFFVYDANGRLTEKSYDGSHAVASYAYDDESNLLGITDSTGQTSLSRDAMSRVSSITYPDGLGVSFAYDPVGNMTSITYPGGLIATYEYDARNRITKLAWDSNSISYTYDPASNLKGETRSNGTSSLYTYDRNNRVVGITHRTGSEAFARMVYTRDAVGKTVQESVSMPESVTLSSESVEATYNEANQVISWGPDLYTYDSDGNLTGISGSRSLSATYDAEHRMTALTRNGVTRNYVYNGLGQRTQVVAGLETRKFHYDTSGRLLFETDGNGAMKVCYLYVGERLSALRTSTGTEYYYHFDKTGNTIALSDESGTAAASYAYLPHGTVISQTTPIPNRFTYVGAHGVQDDGDGIYFMKNRYYDSISSRFMQKDPIGFADGTNLYAYAMNNPVEFIDPDGTLALTTAIAIVCGLVTVYKIGKAVVKAYSDVSETLSEKAKQGQVQQTTKELDRAVAEGMGDDYVPGLQGVEHMMDAGGRVASSTLDLTETVGEEVGQGILLRPFGVAGEAVDTAGDILDELGD